MAWPARRQGPPQCEVERIIRLHRKLLLEAWHDFFGR